MWNSLLEFIQSVVRLWWWLVPGLVIGLIGLYEWISKRPLPLPLPSWARVTVVVGALLIAAFLAFHEVREQRDMSQVERKAVDILAVFLANGRKIYLRKVSSDDEYTVWIDELRLWRQNTGEHLREHFNQAEALSFRNPGSVTAASITNSYNEAHNSNRLTLDLQVEILRDTIKRYGS